jgi:hypothetical protein
MVRALKVTCTVNFLLATAVLFGFVLYCLVTRRDVDSGWGFEGHHVRSDPSWFLVCIYQSALLLMSCKQRWDAQAKKVSPRFVCILLGVLGPALTLTDAFGRGHPQTFDVMLITYIGLSDIAYGLFPTRLFATNDT